MARILFISTLEAFAWGGSEELWSTTAERMVAAGHQIACCVSSSQSEHPRIAQLKNAGCEVITRQMNISLFTRIWDRFSPQSCKTKIASPFSLALSRFKPELVLISQGGNLCINPYAEECRDAKIPYCSIVQSVPEALYIPDDGNYQKIANSYLGAKRVFFVSEGNRLVLERQIAKCIPKAGRCYNPVNLKSREIEDWPSSNETLSLACVARMEFYAKGQDIILDVLDQPKWRNRKITVSFFSSGPNEQLLQDLIIQRNLSSAIFCGRSDDIRDVWKLHHALILPSRQEGLPLSLVEAALCGRPAIVTNIAGNTEVTIDGKTGFVASAPTATELDAAMERAWGARGSFRELGINARNRVLDHFPADPVAHFIGEIETLLSCS
jgi:glycosyltransferase involved in cell wall biosynthesis